MDRETFIDGYVKRSDIEKFRTSDGFQFPGGTRKIAMPCACGAEECEGWAMVSEDMMETHQQLYAPSGPA